MKDERLAPNFLLSEFLISETAARKGIDNTPTPEHIHNLRTKTAPGIQRVRDLINRVHPGREVGIIVTSGYRSKALNDAIGGSIRSQHSRGEAADFVSPRYGTPKEICLLILEHAELIKFDQLIYEGSWVHISFADNPRGEALTAHFEVGGTTRYTRGIA